jgi:hypothetical protein
LKIRQVLFVTYHILPLDEITDVFGGEGSCSFLCFFKREYPTFSCVILCVIYVATTAGGSDTKRENLILQKEKGLANHRFTRPLRAQDRISFADPKTLARGVPNDPRAPLARWFFHLSACASQLELRPEPPARLSLVKFASLLYTPNEKTPQHS